MKRSVYSFRRKFKLVPKGSYILFFLLTTGVFAVLQYFVFRQLRRYIRTYFADKAAKWMTSFKWVFIIMNIPVVLMYFRRELAAEFPLVTNIILYPYTVWIFLLIFWTLVLIPIVGTRVVRTKFLSNLVK